MVTVLTVASFAPWTPSPSSSTKKVMVVVVPVLLVTAAIDLPSLPSLPSTPSLPAWPSGIKVFVTTGAPPSVLGVVIVITVPCTPFCTVRFASIVGAIPGSAFGISKTSISTTLESFLTPFALVAVTGISNLPTTVGIPLIVWVLASYVTPDGNWLSSISIFAPSVAFNTTLRIALFTRVIWLEGVASKSNWVSTTLTVMISRAVAPPKSALLVAFKRIR